MHTPQSPHIHKQSITLLGLLDFHFYCLDSQSKHCILMPPVEHNSPKTSKDPGSNYARHSHFIAFLWYNLCPEKQNIDL